MDDLTDVIIRHLHHPHPPTLHLNTHSHAHSHTLSSPSLPLMINNNTLFVGEECLQWDRPPGRAGPSFDTAVCQCATNYCAQTEWGHSRMGSLAKQTCRACGGRRGCSKGGREGTGHNAPPPQRDTMTEFSNRPCHPKASCPSAIQQVWMVKMFEPRTHCDFIISPHILCPGILFTSPRCRLCDRFSPHLPKKKKKSL